MKVSLFKIGIILSVIGMIWISVVFLERDKISEDFLLESSSSHSIKLDLWEKTLGITKF